MYSRAFQPPDEQSYLLLGPRGTGKSWLVRQLHGEGIYIDLLQSSVYNRLLAQPDRLADMIPAGHEGWVVIDEIQKIPALMDEVHRLIESRRLRFALTGSSARALRRRGTNLLAGRALSVTMHPLTAQELGGDFDLRRALRFGMLPQAWQVKDPGAFLQSYVHTYLQEEVRQEGMTRNLAAFGRFLEAASFAQGSPLNTASIARECAVNRKTVEGHFSVLRDTLLSRELPVFSRRAKRRLLRRVKFYFFDAGVFRALRPRGPLDVDAELDGAGLETLVMQSLTALNEYRRWGYGLHYWHTAQGVEVDFVLYGERGLCAIEVKASARPPSRQDLRGLRLFGKDYPDARRILLYTGTQELTEQGISIVPVGDFLCNMERYL